MQSSPTFCTRVLFVKLARLSQYQPLFKPARFPQWTLLDLWIDQMTMHFSGLGLNIEIYITLFTNLAHMVQMLLLWLFFLPSKLVSQAVTISAPIPALKQWAILDLYLSSLGYSCRSLASVGVEHPLVGVEHLLIGVELQLQGPCRGEVRWPDLYLAWIVLPSRAPCATTAPPSHFLAHHPVSLVFRPETLNWLVNQPSVCW